MENWHLKCLNFYFKHLQEAHLYGTNSLGIFLPKSL